MDTLTTSVKANCSKLITNNWRSSVISIVHFTGRIRKLALASKIEWLRCAHPTGIWPMEFLLSLHLLLLLHPPKWLISIQKHFNWQKSSLLARFLAAHSHLQSHNQTPTFSVICVMEHSTASMECGQSGLQRNSLFVLTWGSLHPWTPI